jgi:hypothetical protein
VVVVVDIGIAIGGGGGVVTDSSVVVVVVLTGVGAQPTKATAPASSTRLIAERIRGVISIIV